MAFVYEFKFSLSFLMFSRLLFLQQWRDSCDPPTLLPQDSFSFLGVPEGLEERYIQHGYGTLA